MHNHKEKKISTTKRSWTGRKKKNIKPKTRYRRRTQERLLRMYKKFALS
jgi:hypothetical protein